jgi:hypothetical protein
VTVLNARNGIARSREHRRAHRRLERSKDGASRGSRARVGTTYMKRASNAKYARGNSTDGPAAATRAVTWKCQIFGTSEREAPVGLQVIHSASSNPQISQVTHRASGGKLGAAVENGHRRREICRLATRRHRHTRQRRAGGWHARLRNWGCWRPDATAAPRQRRSELPEVVESRRAAGEDAISNHAS